MNETQLRVVRFVGTGAAIGIVIGMLLAKFGGMGRAEDVVSMSIIGMMVGGGAAWFTGLK